MRNTYDIAYDKEGNLFGAENSGERDDPEELNWIRAGHHYGFPWRIGGNDTPLQFSPYDVDADPLVNPLVGGYINGYFDDDPAYPPAPAGITFTEPIQNFGPDADKYRDAITGEVKDASDEGISITSFSSHRAPVGLVIDAEEVLGDEFTGDVFMTSYMPGGDSSGYTELSPWGSPSVFVDPCRDLLHMSLIYDFALDNYTMSTRRIAEGFLYPIDMVQAGHGGKIKIFL